MRSRRAARSRTLSLSGLKCDRPNWARTLGFTESVIRALCEDGGIGGVRINIIISSVGKQWQASYNIPEHTCIHPPQTTLYLP
jgi:hypothetical protein